MSSPSGRAIIIGAGPAGLTAAFELLQQTRVEPWIFEAAQELGGLSRTVNYKGNRLDIGGHRFFSKSDRVMNWWTQILPIDPARQNENLVLHYRGAARPWSQSTVECDPQSDRVMLVRSRLSRIFFQGHLFDYPIKLDLQTFRGLGLLRTLKIGLSYLRARAFPRPERSLEDFFINRFGRELYQTFFRDYTEKVWGVPCSQIAPDWGAQRIRGLSVEGALRHAWRGLWQPARAGLDQRETDTSLVETFLYPKFGPGQMWETVAEKVQLGGGQLRTRHCVTGLHCKGKRLEAVTVRNLEDGLETRVEGDYFISTMPLGELVRALRGVSVPAEVARVAAGLPFRDFITVGLLVRRLSLAEGGRIPDNWIYIQDPNVKVGRLQIFNNWSPHMVKDPDTVWLGLEYFVNEGDALWNLSDEGLRALGVAELASIGMLNPDDVLDGMVVRMQKTYPAYFGTYGEFSVLRQYLDAFENLFLVGRNGMHRYNNQDHSMLTAMAAVENIAAGRSDKSNIWAVNADEAYHEDSLRFRSALREGNSRGEP